MQYSAVNPRDPDDAKTTGNPNENNPPQSWKERFKSKWNEIWSTPQYRRFMMLFAWFILVCYLTSVGNAIAEDRGYDNLALIENSHLPDIGYSLIYAIFGKGKNTANIWTYSNDLIVLLMIGLTLALTLIFMKNYRIIIFKRWLLMFNIIFLVRSVTCFSTTFPYPEYSTSSSDCIFYRNVFTAAFTMLTGKLSCYDYFFSGHVANGVMCVVLMHKYGYIYLIVQKQYHIYFYYLLITLSWILLVLLIFSILILQVHYTVDMEAALIFTILLWYVMDYQIELQRGWFYKWEPYEEYIDINDDINDNVSENDIEHSSQKQQKEPYDTIK